MFASAVLAQASLNLTLPTGEHRIAVFTVTTESGRHFDYYDHCRGGIATTLFTHSNHPGHNNGRFEEDNDGWDGRCYLDRHQRFFVSVKALINSQRSDTLGFGGGLNFRPIEIPAIGPLDQVVLDVGVEGSVIYYAKRFGRGATVAPLISPYIGVSAKFGEVRIGMVQYWLPEGIVLRGNTLSGSSEMVGVHGTQTHHRLNVPALSGSTADKPRPMIFFHYPLNLL